LDELHLKRQISPEGETLLKQAIERA